MGVEAIPSSGGASRWRAGRGRRAVAMLMVAILAGCGSGAPTTPPVPTEPASPVATAGPGQAAPSQTAPGSPEGDVAVTAITYSEDPASRFFAVVELGPNDAGISRLDVCRGADGRLSSIVAYGAEDLPAIITFDPEGRPLRMDASGYVVAFTYPASDVEVVITAPDGSVVRQRGPLDLGAAVPAPAAPNARLASYLQEPPLPGMVQWPITFYSSSVVQLEVLPPGPNRGSMRQHVRFPKVLCTPDAKDAAMSCTPTLTWSTESGQPTARLEVGSSTFDKLTASSGSLIWRTQADCDAYTPYVDGLLSNVGWGLMGASGIYQVFSVAGAGIPPLGAGLFLLGAVITIRRAVIVSKPDCLKVPNLQKVQDEFFDQRSTQTATITVTASGDCVGSPETGWRIKEPTTQTFTFEPFNPVNRSSPDYAQVDWATGEVLGPVDRDRPMPVVGTITFQAADCAVDMEGTFDLAATAATAGMPPGDADDWAKMITKNQILLELNKADAQPTLPIDVTGTFALTYRVSGRGYVTGYDDCVVTSTVTGTLEGKMTQAGGYGGFATIKMVPSLRDCPADFFILKTTTLKNVVWTASVTDETTLNGEIVFTANLTAVGGPPVSWIFTVKAKP